MPHWKKHFNYKYTGAYEMVPDEERVLTFTKTADELVKNERGEDNMCFVAYFKEVDKPLIINKVNSKQISKLYGPFDENWIGKQITVFVRNEKAFGEMIDVLRIRPTIPKAVEVNYKACENLLKNCKDMSELQKVYLSFTQDQKTGTINMKEEMKTKLTKS
ncbi:MAG: hypothetical protein ACOH1N_14195 [Lutibacter sp.]